MTVRIAAMSGNDWNQLNSEQKIFYLSGFNAGYFAGVIVSNGHPTENNLTISQHVVAIDQCYSDPRNLKLPITVCYAFAVGQSKGLPPEQLEASLAKMRNGF